MKYFAFLFGLIALSTCSCTEKSEGMVSSTSEVPEIEEMENQNSFEEDSVQITKLIREVYFWLDWGSQLEPEFMLDSSTVFYGISLFDLDIIAEDLSSSDFFTEKFIENYTDIYLAIDEKLNSGELVYEIGALPPYGNGANPWCNCQDVPYDEPNPWKEIEIETISLTKTTGQFNWKWANVDSDWGKHRYYFEVEKVGGKWKISHLAGFTHEAFFGKK